MAFDYERPDFRTLPDNALLGEQQLCAPIGPLPYRRSKFLELCRDGKAPAPAMKEPRCTRWRWGDIRVWLDQLAGREG